MSIEYFYQIAFGETGGPDELQLAATQLLDFLFKDIDRVC